jgi:toxin-antitoxin system PIN domain toxin
MTFLLDVNVLIALVDQDHVHHERAHCWTDALPSHQWATCPLVENAFVRITSGSKYPNRYPSAVEALAALRDNCAVPSHVFWPDDVSICQPSLWQGEAAFIGSHLTDLYLLALAVRHGGKLASFDQRIPAHFVHHGRQALQVISA